MEASVSSSNDNGKEASNEVVPSANEISRKESMDDLEVVNGFRCLEILKPPETGNTFESLDALFEYYREYGRQEGFGVKKKTSRPSPCGKLKFFSFSCSRAGKSVSHKQNYLTPNPLTRIQCKARVNSTMFEDGHCKINSVTLEHNHELSPSKSQFYSCNKGKVIGVRRKIAQIDPPGAVVMSDFRSVALVESDHSSYPEKGSQLQLRFGDAKAIQDYFARMQVKNSSFFYIMDMDDNATVKNVFWSDARNRAMFEEFSDVVTLDTSYLLSKYQLPLATFLGVNHHGQTVMFGCALLSNNDTVTLTWLFKAWLSCMSGRAPNAMITDDHESTTQAVDSIFPETRHRWCLTMVMKTLVDGLKECIACDEMKSAFQDAIYESSSEKEFEESWERIMKKFELRENNDDIKPWLSRLYQERRRWVPAFLKDTFWAGMSTTQRDESSSPFFEGRLNSKTTLKQFIDEYDKALRNKVEKEHLADFQCFSTWIPCVTLFEIEKQFQVAYTNAKFKEFQKELTGKLYCEVTCVNEKDGTFDVSEVVFAGENRKQVHFKVQFSSEKSEVKCSCGLFEFRGILCKHAISVLMKMEIINVPEKYILPRWRKDLKRYYTRVRVSYYEDWTSNIEMQRYEKLRKRFDEAADFGIVSDEKMAMLLNSLDEFQSKARVQHFVEQRDSC